jgi:hypothetical protein
MKGQPSTPDNSSAVEQFPLEPSDHQQRISLALDAGRRRALRFYVLSTDKLSYPHSKTESEKQRRCNPVLPALIKGVRKAKDAAIFRDKPFFPFPSCCFKRNPSYFRIVVPLVRMTKVAIGKVITSPVIILSNLLLRRSLLQKAPRLIPGLWSG